MSELSQQKTRQHLRNRKRVMGQQEALSGDGWADSPYSSPNDAQGAMSPDQQAQYDSFHARLQQALQGDSAYGGFAPRHPGDPVAAAMASGAMPVDPSFATAGYGHGGFSGMEPLAQMGPQEPTVSAMQQYAMPESEIAAGMAQGGNSGNPWFNVGQDAIGSGRRSSRPHEPSMSLYVPPAPVDDHVPPDIAAIQAIRNRSMVSNPTSTPTDVAMGAPGGAPAPNGDGSMELVIRRMQDRASQRGQEGYDPNDPSTWRKDATMQAVNASSGQREAYKAKMAQEQADKFAGRQEYITANRPDMLRARVLGNQQQMFDKAMSGEQGMGGLMYGAQGYKADIDAAIAREALKARQEQTTQGNAQHELDARRSAAAAAVQADPSLMEDPERLRRTVDAMVGGDVNQQAMGDPQNIGPPPQQEDAHARFGPQIAQKMRDFYDTGYEDASWLPGWHGGIEEFVRQAGGNGMDPNTARQWYEQNYPNKPKFNPFMFPPTMEMWLDPKTGY